MSPERGGAGADEPPQRPVTGVPSAPPPAWPVRQLHPLPLPAHAPLHRLRPTDARAGAAGGWCWPRCCRPCWPRGWACRPSTGTPRGPVRKRLPATTSKTLADGDAPAALAYAADPPRGQWLTSVVLAQQLRLAPLTDISVLPARRLGSTATIEVRYRLQFHSGSRSVTDTARLIRRGSSWWMSRVASTVRVAGGSPGADRLRLGGRKLPAAAVALFPGALPVTADPPGLRVFDVGPASGADDQPTVRLADTQLLTRLGVSMSAALRGQVEQAVDRLLAGCLEAGSNDPLCPVPGSGRPVPGSLRGSAPPIAAVKPRIGLAPAQPGVINVRAEVPVQGSWKVWDFENQVVQRRGRVTVVLNARIGLDRPTEAFWDPS